MSNRVPGLFVTGTDTDVGKTYVAALIARSLVARGFRVGVYKPAASGCRQEHGTLVSDDAVALWNAAGQPGELERVCPQRFVAPVAPYLAARSEAQRLDAELLRSGIDYWGKRSDIILVEGAGGLMSPVSDVDYVADLAVDFAFPLVVVARNTLGTLNQTLQTLIAASVYREGLCVAGVVLNQPSRPSKEDVSLATNRRELVVRCRVPVLAGVTWGGTDFDTEVDWAQLAKSQAKWMPMESGEIPPQ